MARFVVMTVAGIVVIVGICKVWQAGQQAYSSGWLITTGVAVIFGLGALFFMRR